MDEAYPFPANAQQIMLVAPASTMATVHWSHTTTIISDVVPKPLCDTRASSHKQGDSIPASHLGETVDVLLYIFDTSSYYVW
jgi:hypothetical protein